MIPRGRNMDDKMIKLLKKNTDIFILSFGPHTCCFRVDIKRLYCRKLHLPLSPKPPWIPRLHTVHRCTQPCPFYFLKRIPFFPKYRHINVFFSEFIYPLLFCSGIRNSPLTPHTIVLVSTNRTPTLVCLLLYSFSVSLFLA